jgi:hypothetical protein
MGRFNTTVAIAEICILIRANYLVFRYGETEISDKPQGYQ